MEELYTYFFAGARWVLAILSVCLVAAWLRYFLKTRRHRTPFAALVTDDGLELTLFSMENLIGRGKSSDVMLPIGGIAKRHALISFEKGHWMLTPLDGKVQINLQNVRRTAPLDYGDKLCLAGQTLTFKYLEDNEISSKSEATPTLPLTLLTAFQIVLGTTLCLRFFDGLDPLIPLLFFLLIAGQWIYCLFGRLHHGFKMLMELPVLYLATLGLSVTASCLPDQLLKQAVCFAAGFVGFLVITLVLKHRDFVIKLRRIIMVLSLALLYFTAFFGTKINSARNWLVVGSFSFQPSELMKVAFVAAGGITLCMLSKNKLHRSEFLIYAFLALGALAIMLDFGAVAIFFVGMLTMLALRLESPLLMGSICGAALIGGGGVLLLFPYVARRFGSWLNAWELADSQGYQQTRTMMSFASGGMLGVGPGDGNLKQVAAAETDLVFGILGEEYGAIIAVTAALCIVAIALYGFRLITHSPNIFDAVTVGGATAVIVFQSALNIFGSVDILPLTGVTFIFVSVGGSSLISAFMMMAFFKAAELHRPSSRQWRDTE